MQVIIALQQERGTLFDPFEGSALAEFERGRRAIMTRAMEDYYRTYVLQPQSFDVDIDATSADEGSPALNRNLDPSAMPLNRGRHVSGRRGVHSLTQTLKISSKALMGISRNTCQLIASPWSTAKLQSAWTQFPRVTLNTWRSRLVHLEAASYANAEHQDAELQEDEARIEGSGEILRTKLWKGTLNQRETFRKPLLCKESARVARPPRWMLDETMVVVEALIAEHRLKHAASSLHNR
jgi:hypothetical protein